MSTAHSISTDSDGIKDKIYLRQQALKSLTELKVLDLFAGENVIWGQFQCAAYYGIESVTGKGKNLNAKNERVIPSLDLSRYNVVDCDSYGIPYNQIYQLFENETLQGGTVIIYTAISNRMSTLNKKCIDKYISSKTYEIAKSLFNALAHELFYALLFDKGVKEVYFYEKYTTFIKHYGYFIVDKSQNIWYNNL